MIRALSISFAVCATTAALVAQPQGFTIETVVDGLQDAVTMAFAPDGRLFLTERMTGAIRVVEDGQLQAQPWANVGVFTNAGSEAGFLGIAIHPDFPSNGQVYVNYLDQSGGWSMEFGRFQEVGGSGANFTLFETTPFTGRHVAGRMGFGRDGYLYLTRGETGLPRLAQSLGSAYGKVHRFVDDGSVPVDNPYVGVPGAIESIWAYGLRNPFGLCFHPDTGQPFTIGNGGRNGDEVHGILRAGNFGWPMHEGPQPDDGVTEPPIYSENPQPAYTGGDFYAGRAFPPEYRADMFVGAWKFPFVYRLDFDAAGALIDTSIFYQAPGPVFDVKSGPDGALYVLHSTAAGTRGADRVSRIVFDTAPNPSVHVSALTTQAVGGTVTVGIVGAPNTSAASWLAFQQLPAPLPTPFGDLHVNPALVLPSVALGADGRGHLPIQVADDPGLFGQTIYVQGAADGGTGLTLTPPTEFTF